MATLATQNIETLNEWHPCICGTVVAVVGVPEGPLLQVARPLQQLLRLRVLEAALGLMLWSIVC